MKRLLPGLTPRKNFDTGETRAFSINGVYHFSPLHKLPRQEKVGIDVRRERNHPIWLIVPAQSVDATPSRSLIGRCFLRRTHLLGCIRSIPSQGSVPTDLLCLAILAFVFTVSGVPCECCVDLLRPPGKPDIKCRFRLRAEFHSCDFRVNQSRVRYHQV
jgi:hypothetical protein